MEGIGLKPEAKNIHPEMMKFCVCFLIIDLCPEQVYEKMCGIVLMDKYTACCLQSQT